VKPWQGPLPKSRVSPPKTLGDAVIKKFKIRVRGRQTVLVLLKMVLPSMTNGSSSGQTPPQQSERNISSESWPSLLEIRSPQITQGYAAWSLPDAANFESSSRI
jgi:hypothetical protein